MVLHAVTRGRKSGHRSSGTKIFRLLVVLVASRDLYVCSICNVFFVALCTTCVIVFMFLSAYFQDGDKREYKSGVGVKKIRFLTLENCFVYRMFL
jgi:hypothetical protein